MQKFRVEEENGEGFEVVKHEDVIMPTLFQGPERLKILKELEYVEGDVLLCSYPKTGSHWVANLTKCLLSKEPIENYQSVALPLFDMLPWDRILAIPRPAVIGTHLKYDRMPTQHFQNGGKTILLVRNVKDTAVSYYYHMLKQKVTRCNISWAFYLECFLNGKLPYGSYFDFMDSWQEAVKERGDILVVVYEQLVKDTVSGLNRIQSYLGTSKTQEELVKIVKRCSLETLKSDVDTGKTQSYLVDEDGKSFLYRKGIIGDWKNHFTVAQNEQIDAIIAERLRDCMFTFIYES